MRSKPYHLINNLFAPVWEKSGKYGNEKYRGGGRDLRAAKEFLELNPDVLDEENFVVEFQERAMAYLDVRFDGYTKSKHPAYLFLERYQSFVQKKEIRSQRKCEIHGIAHDGILCPKCCQPLNQGG